MTASIFRKVEENSDTASGKPLTARCTGDCAATCHVLSVIDVEITELGAVVCGRIRVIGQYPGF